MSGRLYSILGCKDSVGATSLAVNAAFLLHKLTKKKVLLADFDFAYQGEMAGLLKMEKTCLATDLFSFVRRNLSASMLEGFIPRHGQGVHVLQVFDPKKIPDDFASPQLDKVLGLLMDHFDYVILDGGSQWTPFHMMPLMGSSLIHVLALPEKNYVRESKNRIEQLMRAYVSRDKIEVVLNRCARDCVDLRRVEADLDGQKFHLLPQAGSRMAESVAEGLPIVLADVRNAYTLALEDLLKKVLMNDGLPAFSAKDASHGEAHQLLPFWNRTVGFKGPDTVEQTAPTASTDAKWDVLKGRILKLLLKKVDLKDVQIGRKTSRENEGKLREKTTEAILKVINDLDSEIELPGDRRKQLVSEVLFEALGLGPLESLLSDKAVSEIMINGKDQIYVEKAGKLQLSSLRFSSDDQLHAIIERIVAPIGRRVDESTPLVDARLSDGSRVNIIIPPLSLVGPVVTIRRFSETPFQVKDLVRFGTLTDGMATFLDAAINIKLNIIVSGGTGSGKTTLLNVLSSFIPEGDRIVTIEDAAELKLHQPHVVSLESRPPNIEGKGEIPIRTLLKNSLRMRPDRIVIGECRGGEALDMLQAMNTGHDGSLTTIHSNSPRDCVARMETLVMYSGVPLPSRAIRSQIASAINLIIQLNRLSDGTRKITHITELTGMEGEVVTLQDIFVFKQTGVDSNRRVVGHYTPTGFMPRFMDTLKQKGIELSPKHFEPVTPKS